jgi:hypothetical protein
MMRLGGVMVALLLAVACSSSPTSGDPQPQGGSGGTSPPSGGPPPMPSNGLCNTLNTAGGTIMDQLAANPPSLNGGSLVDGNYVLTKYEWYTPNQLHARSITLVVTGGGAYGQYLWTRDTDPEQRINVAIATNGSQIAMRATCPVGQDLEWDQYGMTASGMTLFSSRDNKAAFFSRQ